MAATLAKFRRERKDMYSRIPCAMPNSKTPLDGRPVFPYNWVASAMDRSNAGYRELVESLGGVWPGESVWGAAGVGAGGQSSGSGSGSGSGGSAAAAAALAECLGVQLAPVPGSYSPPPPPMAAPRAVVVTSQQARHIEMPAAQALGPDPAICETVTAANVCELAVRGCFKAGQVDPAQLAACASVGWQGNYNQFPALIARGGGNKGQPVGVLNSSPSSPRGMSGIDGGQAINIMQWGALLLGAGIIAAAIKGARR